jgi:hypothetical protein
MITARKLVPFPPSPLPDKLYAAIDGTGVPVTAKETAGRDGKGEDGVSGPDAEDPTDMTCPDGDGGSRVARNGRHGISGVEVAGWRLGCSPTRSWRSYAVSRGSPAMS